MMETCLTCGCSFPIDELCHHIEQCERYCVLVLLFAAR